MARPNPNPAPGPPPRRRITPLRLLLYILLGFILLSFVLQLLGVNIMSKTEDSEIIDRPHEGEPAYEIDQ